ncbi:hypothetical protein ACF5W4_05085 [Bacillota bacterium Lsc_1132]
MDESKEQFTADGQTASSQGDEDHFSRFMFGRARRVPEEKIQQPSINYEELMSNIDTLMESARNLKPLFDKVYPKISQFFLKKK